MGLCDCLSQSGYKISDLYLINGNQDEIFSQMCCCFQFFLNCSLLVATILDLETEA